MANPAYDQALATGKVVIRKWWFNQNSDKNQISLQFQQAVERPQTQSSATSTLIGLAQGSTLGNTTRVTTLFSADATLAANVLGSREGDATMGSPVVLGNAFFSALAQAMGTEFTGDLAIQITENLQKNPRAPRQTPKSNPNTGEIVMSYDATSGSMKPVYRHTELVDAAHCEHTFLTPQPAPVIATPPVAPTGTTAATVAPFGSEIAS